jgi:hypothetical protein
MELYLYSLNMPSWHGAELKKSTGTPLLLDFIVLRANFPEHLHLSPENCEKFC